MESRHTFIRGERLKSSKAIDRIFREGRSFFAPPLKVYYSLPVITTPQEVVESQPVSPTAQVRAGFTVPKKLFKKAVHRNHIKRLLREAYRLHKHKLEGALQQSGAVEVFFVFTDKTLPAYSLVEEKMKYCVRRLVKSMEEKP